MEKSLKSATKKIIIGRVGAAQGVKGEFRVYPLTDFPDRFEGLKRAYIGDEEVEIISTRYQNNFIVMRIADINAREQVAAITNKLMYVDRCDVPPLAEGEYYSFDIIGLKVISQTGQQLGTVKQILKTGANDVYLVQTPEQKELLVPALKKVVTEINLEAGEMHIIWEEPVEVRD